MGVGSLYREPEAAQKLARKGRALVLETYDWDTLAYKLETIWERMAYDHRTPAGLAVLRGS